MSSYKQQFIFFLIAGWVFLVAITAVIFAEQTEKAFPNYLAGIPTNRIDLTDKQQKKVRAITKLTVNFSSPEKFETMQGGAGSSKKLINRDAFSHSSSNITFDEEMKFKLGNALFRKLWVSSPSSTQASDGLGPLFNARSCQSCHIKDGRGHPPEGDSNSTSMLVRLARSAANDDEAQKLMSHSQLNFPDPIYGKQLQDLAVPGLKSEGRISIAYEELPFQLADGVVVSLRKPTYSITHLAYGSLHPKTTLSVRIASPMIGLGLIEAIHPADIVSLADPDDLDGDGISGRVPLAYDPAMNEVILGRFGWKAQNTSIKAQSAAAFSGDIGISTPEHPNSFGDCTTFQKACFTYPNGVQKHLGNTEASSNTLDLVTFYSQNLAVPIRRNVSDSEVLKGKKLFYESGCVSCHNPKFVTRQDAENKAHAFQLIWPYSDLLLHDMGEGLADGQTVGSASGSEWRTPPLWGIGLTKTVNNHTFFLHDGRARNLTEAILWHGGEAQVAKTNFANLKKAKRESLIKFLESL